jgi:hypothetical protein
MDLKGKLGALSLGTYRLIIITSFWCISPFISMEYPSLSHSINVCLKSTLSKINVATPACFGEAIGLVNLPAFHPKPVLVSVHKWVSCKQQIAGSSFLIQFAKWCLLMGGISPLIFSVNIDRYSVILVI